MARRLLIVEDDPDIAGLLVELFSSSSYEAESTPSGVEA
jgi:DNA-binding response OmpR family regulator